MKHVIFFYESHTDLSATNTILSCKEWLKKFGITSLAIEKPADQEPLFNHQSMKLYASKTKGLTDVLKDFHNPLYSKWIDEMFKASGYMRDLETYTMSDKERALKCLLSQLKSEFESNLKLQMAKDSLKCEAFSMDLQSASRSPSWDEAETLVQRDNAMCRNIQEHSRLEGSKILVLVGANHNRVAELLKETGEYTINEIFFDARYTLQTSVTKIETKSVELLREKFVKQQGTDIYIETSKTKTKADADKYAEQIFQKVAPNLYMQEILEGYFQPNQGIVQLINEYSYEEERDLVGTTDGDSEGSGTCVVA